MTTAFVGLLMRMLSIPVRWLIVITADWKRSNVEQLSIFCIDLIRDAAAQTPFQFAISNTSIPHHSTFQS